MSQRHRKKIAIDSLDSTFKFQVARERGGEMIVRCFDCGTCSASCPVRQVNERFNPRRIVHMVLLGMRQQVLTDDFVWLCASCYTCQERCPQGVKIADLMIALRNIAVREGHIHPFFSVQMKILSKAGRLMEIGDLENKKRCRFNLPSLRQDDSQVRVLLEKSGFLSDDKEGKGD
ncbi:4Fe-4S dicluster domain-containing protein [bacterium]|nr:4Fe-4S dicluster domain-containing protein [bacterium]